MPEVKPLPSEQTSDERRRSSQPWYDGQHPALTQPQRQPGAPADGKLHTEQEQHQLHFGEQPYTQLQMHGRPTRPDEPDLAPDSQYSWTVAGAAAWNIFCCSLLRRGMPVLFHAVSETFSTTAKGSVAWTNAFIYSMAYTLSPVTTSLCRTMSLRLLSVSGAILIGVGQIACFALGSLSLVVPAIAVSSGLGAALSTVVDETTLYLYFAAQRQQASYLYQAAFSMSAIVYPLVLLVLLDSYGLNGTLLVSGAVSLNALIGSMFMSRPVWMSPSIPLPPIHRPKASQINAPAAVQPVAHTRENTTKEGVNQKPEVRKPGAVGDEHPAAAKELHDAHGAAPPHALTGPPSVPPPGTASVEPGKQTPAGGDAKARPEVATVGGGGLHNSAAPQPTPDMPVGVIMAWHCALTSLSVTAGVVLYDYVMDDDTERSPQAAFVVMALQAFLQGGLLFLMAMSKKVVLLAPASFGLGWMSSTLEMLSLPVLQRFLEPDAVEQQLSMCRVASGVACLCGPLLVTLFRDDGPQSYGVMFIVSGGLSLLAGALWLPGVKKEMDEARAKAAAVVATDKTAQPIVAEAGQHAAAAVPGATKQPDEVKAGAAAKGPVGVPPPVSSGGKAVCAEADAAKSEPKKDVIPAAASQAKPAAPV
ncbi:hypothetical protein HPB52_013971 [Rhipicephalus sanguineus]|uniref:Monocarboxylate transporter n=1 Tax=Rhipicephalus sanguineus TaxID=34632 RepID=A0A9D4PBQ4_RHISA|nr:hypothetical protein HPB52_013971 [Rhipicephalus sanguineus]